MESLPGALSGIDGGRTCDREGSSAHQTNIEPDQGHQRHPEEDERCDEFRDSEQPRSAGDLAESETSDEHDVYPEGETVQGCCSRVMDLVINSASLERRRNEGFVKLAQVFFNDDREILKP